MAFFPDEVTEIATFVNKNPGAGISGTPLNETTLNPIVNNLNGVMSALGALVQGNDTDVVSRLNRIENDNALWALLGE
jgi:hypothetical protein